jgi:hypothetical protein
MGKFVDLSNQTIGKWYVCNRVQDKIYPNGRRLYSIYVNVNVVRKE